MSGPRKLWVHSNAPIPRRTLYRWRKEAERREQGQESSDSEQEQMPDVTQPAPNTRAARHGIQDHFSSESDSATNPRSRSSLSDGDESRSNDGSSSGPQTSQDSESEGDGENDGVISSELSSEAEEIVPMEEEIEPRQVDNIHENEDGEREAELNQRLCPCTTTTEGDALLMCLALGIRHNMSWVAIVDLLSLINNLYGKEVVHSSKHFLFKFFDMEKDSAVAHIYCPACESSLGTQAFVEEQNIVQCQCGEAVTSKGSSSSFFVSVKLKDRLRNLMETPEVAQEILTYRFQRQKENNDSIEDIFDGEGYKTFFEPGGLLSEGCNFSITMNTDGMDLGTSSSRSAWPIFLYINELSPANRKKHVIFAGIWVGKKQPNMRIFLAPFVDELRHLFTHGFLWNDVNNVQQSSKVVPLIAVLDSGARYKFLNLTSHAGYYGCTFCYQRAENTTVGRRFTIVRDAAGLRTQESMLRDMQRAHDNRNQNDAKKRVYKGCKGFTPLVRLHPYLNLGSGVIVDFMHNALLGVTRSLTSIFLKTVNLPYYLGKPEDLHTMDNRLLSIKPPKSISRTPRNFKYCKKWKASEWRTFLLFYGLICYDGLLPQKYFEHFAMLSAGIFILLQKSITHVELETAHTYLVQFVYLYQEYYGRKAMTYNVHLLLHVTQAVLNWGPLWGPNTFVFEGENRHLNQMNTSAGHVALQLTRRYRIFSSFPKLCDTYASSEKPIEFIEMITGKSLKSYVRCSGVVLVGKGREEDLCGDHVEYLAEAGLDGNMQVKSFQRMFYKKIRYTTRDYVEGKKNDDTWIKTKFGTRGCILRIWQLVNHENSEVILLFQEIDIDRQPVIRGRNVTIRHLMRVERRGRIKIIKPCDIAQQCIYFHAERGTFIADVPYGCYGD